MSNFKIRAETNVLSNAFTLSEYKITYIDVQANSAEEAISKIKSMFCKNHIVSLISAL